MYGWEVDMMGSRGGEERRGTRTVKSSHHSDRFGRGEIYGIEPIVVHMRKDFGISGIRTDSGVEMHYGDIGSERTKVTHVSHHRRIKCY